MRSPIMVVVAAIIAHCAVACAQSGSIQAAGGTPSTTKRQLVGPDITKTLAGNTFYWIRARDQATGETIFNADGAMRWKRTDVASSGQGRWSVDGEQLCQHYDPTPNWKGGRVCRKLYAEGETLVTSPNDGGLVTYTQVPAT